MEKTKLILSRKQWFDGTTWFPQPKIEMAVLHANPFKYSRKCPQCWYKLYETGWGSRHPDEPEYICRVCRVTDKDNPRYGQYMGYWTVDGKLSKEPDPNIPRKKCGLDHRPKAIWHGYTYKSAYHGGNP